MEAFLAYDAICFMLFMQFHRDTHACIRLMIIRGCPVLCPCYAVYLRNSTEFLVFVFRANIVSLHESIG